jgi:hypothetical protein
MATLVTARMRFLHVPKTGGSWATQAMFAAGVAGERPAPMPFHAGLAESADFADRFTFGFVRHPLDFWRSYWGYRMRTGWDPDSRLDRAVSSSDFDRFVEGLLRDGRGAAGRIFESYVGPPGAEISFVGRFERLADDLCLALRLAGEDFSEAALRGHPTVNETDYRAYPALYPPSLAERLAESERDAIDRFYAWDPLPARLIADAGPGDEPSSLAVRLERAELALRDARSELSIVRLANDRSADLVRRRELDLVAAERALQTLRDCRTIRWSRPMRTRWHRIQARRSHA